MHESWRRTRGKCSCRVLVRLKCFQVEFEVKRKKKQKRSGKTHAGTKFSIHENVINVYNTYYTTRAFDELMYRCTRELIR